jgi:phage shock protein A
MTAVEPTGEHSMALINRFTRLFTADLHAVLDRMEEPEILLKQAVREMEEALADSERRLRALSVRNQQLKDARSSAAQTLERLSEEMDVCFAADNDDLARTLIRRKLAGERHLTQLEAQNVALAGTLAQLESSVADQRAELLDLRQKAELFLDAAEPVPAKADHALLEPQVTDDDVEVALLREKQQRDKQLREKRGRAGK